MYLYCSLRLFTKYIRLHYYYRKYTFLMARNSCSEYTKEMLRSNNAIKRIMLLPKKGLFSFQQERVGFLYVKCKQRVKKIALFDDMTTAFYYPSLFL